MAINVVGYSRLIGEDEARRPPQPSDSIPFADFRPPQAMAAKRRLRSSDRRAAFGLAIGGLIWQSSVEPTIESLRDRWTRVPAGVDGAKAAAPHLKLGTAFRFVHHGPGVAGRVLVAARAGAIWLGRQC
jgi:hypothetical protein